MTTAQKILLISPLKNCCGNNSTAERLRCHLNDGSYICILKDVADFKDVRDLKQFIKFHKVVVALGLHAYHAGRLLQGCGVPYSIIFGGTDLNEYYTDIDLLTVMTSAVEQAKYLVTFSSALRKRAEAIWADIPADKFLMIPQAVVTNPSEFCIWEFLKGQGYNFRIRPYLFTIVAGIRPVKDPTFLLHEFHEWQTINNLNVFLLIIGPRLDNDCSEKLEKIVCDIPSILYVPGFSLEDTHAVIKDSFALVNSSISEGMSIAILEAMSLGIPVIARNVPGNYAVIKHEETGLLYDTPKGFIKVTEKLISDENLYQKIKSGAIKDIQSYHNYGAEKVSYHCLIESLVNY